MFQYPLPSAISALMKTAHYHRDVLRRNAEPYMVWLHVHVGAHCPGVCIFPILGSSYRVPSPRQLLVPRQRALVGRFPLGTDLSGSRCNLLPMLG